ncbi:MMtag domain-containing protein [Chloropicon roscoffensis]|uniref:MMtag domain-containing protein n=1 Tax=Chloropicon roscoffensis TaxID=1461544 RepID=A0AAX4PJ67_9CHLO
MPRGGTRGGRDQFSWDDVKADKDRQNFLGHSIKAAVGRWQEGRDLLWYERNYASDGSKLGQTSSSQGKPDEEEERKERARAEKEEVKRREEELMQEALGIRPYGSTSQVGLRPPPGSRHRLEGHDVAELLRRGRTTEERCERNAEGERVRGLGSARGGAAQIGMMAQTEVMAGEGLVEEEDRRKRRRRRRSRREGSAEGDGGDGARGEGEVRRRGRHRRRRRRRDVGGSNGSGSRSRSRSRERHDSD